MRQEVEVVLRMLLKADSTIPPGGRIDHAIDVLNGTTHGQDRPFLTTMEAAEALHVNRGTITALVKSGKLNRAVGTFGRTIGVTRESYQRYVRGKMIGEE